MWILHNRWHTMDAIKFLFVSLILICNVTTTVNTCCTSVQQVCILIILNTLHSYSFIWDTTGSTKLLPFSYLTLIAFIFYGSTTIRNVTRSKVNWAISYTCTSKWHRPYNSRPAVGFKNGANHVMQRDMVIHKTNFGSQIKKGQSRSHGQVHVISTKCNAEQHSHEPTSVNLT